jgi:hypothetical protein
MSDDEVYYALFRNKRKRKLHMSLLTMPTFIKSSRNLVLRFNYLLHSISNRRLAQTPW